MVFDSLGRNSKFFSYIVIAHMLETAHLKNLPATRRESVQHHADLLDEFFVEIIPVRFLREEIEVVQHLPFHRTGYHYLLNVVGMFDPVDAAIPDNPENDRREFIGRDGLVLPEKIIEGILDYILSDALFMDEMTGISDQPGIICLQESTYSALVFAGASHFRLFYSVSRM